MVGAKRGSTPFLPEVGERAVRNVIRECDSIVSLAIANFRAEVMCLRSKTTREGYSSSMAP